MKRLERIILALDKSMRVLDENGFLHVAVSNISKAMVCPYNGSEIADIAQEAGVAVDPHRVYFLLRDPEELAAGASTFNGIPLTYVHEPLSSEDLATDPEKKEIVVGALGTDAIFVKPYLQNSLVVWDAAAIQRIQTREQVELSCAYRWVLDMTPGTYEGVAYDGVMRKLRGNHVALVDEGRAGPDVLVADAKPKTYKEQSPMNKKLTPRAIAVRGALLGRIPLSLAADQKLKVSDLTPLVATLTAKNFKASKAKLAEDIKKAFAPRLAQDADLDDILSLLDNLEDGSDEGPDVEDAKPAAVVPPPVAKDDDMAGDGNEAGQELLALLQAQNLPDEVMAQVAALCDKMCPPAAAVDGFPPKKGTAVPNPNDPKALAVGKPAMDAAIQVAADATVARMQAVREAEDLVEPIIGRVRGQNTAEGVFKMALDHAKVPTEGVHPTAYKPLVEMLLRQLDDEPVGAGPLAQDSKAQDAYAKRFNPDRIRR